MSLNLVPQITVKRGNYDSKPYCLVVAEFTPNRIIAYKPSKLFLWALDLKSRNGFLSLRPELTDTSVKIEISIDPILTTDEVENFQFFLACCLNKILGISGKVEIVPE